MFLMVKTLKFLKNQKELWLNYYKNYQKIKELQSCVKQGFEDGIDLKNVKKYKIYRHKSLTRIILVK